MEILGKVHWSKQGFYGTSRGPIGSQPRWGGALARFSVRFSVRHDGSTGRQDSHLIFSSSEQFSTNLLAKNTTVSDATNGAQLLVTHLKSQRTESSFECFYESVVFIGFAKDQNGLIMAVNYISIKHQKRDIDTFIMKL